VTRSYGVVATSGCHGAFEFDSTQRLRDNDHLSPAISERRREAQRATDSCDTIPARYDHRQAGYVEMGSTGRARKDRAATKSRAAAGAPDGRPAHGLGKITR
jgi:hypothetical protein